MRFQTSLLRVVLPLLALSVLASVMVLGRFAHNAMLEQAGRDGQVLAAVVGRSIEVSQRVERGAEKIVAMDLVASARMISQFVAVAEQCRMPAPDIRDRLKSMVTTAGISEILVTDSDAKSYLETTDYHGFQFQADPFIQPQAHEFFRLLKAREDDAVVQPVMPRELDGRPFMYVGVPGVDRPRIVQVGLDGTMLSVLNQSLGVQQLLDHIVKESAIFRVWVVDLDVRTLQFADESEEMGNRLMSDPDRVMLGDVINLGKVQSRLNGDHISVAAPLMTSMNPEEDLEELGKGSGETVEGAILIHMTTGPLEALLYRGAQIAVSSVLIALVGGFFLLSRVTRKVLKPVEEAVEAAERVAAGDLSVNFTKGGDDEIGKLNTALSQMVACLNSLIGKVQHSSSHLVETVNHLIGMSEAQKDGANRMTSATNEIAAASQEISVTSDELFETMASMSELTSATSDFASEGQTSLERMSKVMLDLVDATASISARLSMIAERTTTIASVTTTITKIADQTNLLSLNASMEAEKAGVYGVGFAVLAREIRRLADQTALATLDIEQMVEEMQTAVRGGVSEMERFAEKVDRGAEDTRVSNHRFSEILDNVQIMLPRFESVHEGMKSQATGAKQIRDAMAELKETAEVTRESLESTALATQQLEEAIEILRKEISLFRLR